MSTKINDYDFIADKIHSLKNGYPTLRLRTDDYVFSLLCVRANFYKNPALLPNENNWLPQIEDAVVDGQCDGGADILLTDPNSEGSDLVIGQSKFYRDITQEDVLNAVLKMARFYHDIRGGHYERFNSRVQNRFVTLYSEVGEESKIRFVFYTSAPQKKSIRSELKLPSVSNSPKPTRLNCRYCSAPT